MWSILKLKSVLAKNVRYYRKKLKWTQEFLAEKSDLSVNTIKDIEAGCSWPECATFVSLANALEVDPCSLILSKDCDVIARKKFLQIMQQTIKLNEESSKFIAETLKNEADSPLNFEQPHFSRS